MKYFPALTGLRAIAAYMVFFHHFNFFSQFGESLLSRMVNEFYAGVSVFFVLSGFRAAGLLEQDCIATLSDLRQSPHSISATRPYAAGAIYIYRRRRCKYFVTREL